jgi:nucleoside phosphorylase
MLSSVWIKAADALCGGIRAALRISIAVFSHYVNYDIAAAAQDGDQPEGKHPGKAAGTPQRSLQQMA